MDGQLDGQSSVILGPILLSHGPLKKTEIYQSVYVNWRGKKVIVGGYTFQVLGSQDDGAEMMVLDEGAYLWGHRCTVPAHQ